ncbi:MAG: branched-chain amino acid ABC transporter permease [Thermacetogeniaceae bacterium]
MDKNKQIILALVSVLVLYAVLEALMMIGILGPYWQEIMRYAMVVAIGALGLSIIYGFTGQFSLGHAAFVGIGAYAAGLFNLTFRHYGIPAFLGSLVVGAVVAGLVGYLIGVPILRLKSDYLGIATLGFGFIVTNGLQNADKLIPALGGARGMTGIPQVQSFGWYYALVLIVVILVRNFVFSTHGRACTAIRENETAANVVGVSPARTKIMAFTMGCALAGLGGALYAHNIPFLHPDSFNFLESINYLIVVVLGGLGSLTGTVITAVGWAFIMEVLRMVLGPLYDFRGVIYAIILVVVIIVRPQGVFGGIEASFLVPQIKRRKAHAAAGD